MGDSLFGFFPLQVRDVAVAALATSSAANILSFMPGLVRALADETCAWRSSLFSLLLCTAEQSEEARYHLFYALEVAMKDNRYGSMYASLKDRLLLRIAETLGETVHIKAM